MVVIYSARRYQRYKASTTEIKPDTRQTLLPENIKETKRDLSEVGISNDYENANLLSKNIDEAKKDVPGVITDDDYKNGIFPSGKTDFENPGLLRHIGDESAISEGRKIDKKLLVPSIKDDCKNQNSLLEKAYEANQGSIEVMMDEGPVSLLSEGSEMDEESSGYENQNSSSENVNEMAQDLPKALIDDYENKVLMSLNKSKINEELLGAIAADKLSEVLVNYLFAVTCVSDGIHLQSVKPFVKNQISICIKQIQRLACYMEEDIIFEQIRWLFYPDCEDFESEDFRQSERLIYPEDIINYSNKVNEAIDSLKQTKNKNYKNFFLKTEEVAVLFEKFKKILNLIPADYNLPNKLVNRACFREIVIKIQGLLAIEFYQSEGKNYAYDSKISDSGVFSRYSTKPLDVDRVDFAINNPYFYSTEGNGVLTLWNLSYLYYKYKCRSERMIGGEVFYESRVLTEVVHGDHISSSKCKCVECVTEPKLELLLVLYMKSLDKFMCIYDSSQDFKELRKFFDLGKSLITFKSYCVMLNEPGLTPMGPVLQLKKHRDHVSEIIKLTSPISFFAFRSICSFKIRIDMQECRYDPSVIGEILSMLPFCSDVEFSVMSGRYTKESGYIAYGILSFKGFIKATLCLGIKDFGTGQFIKDYSRDIGRINFVNYDVDYRTPFRYYDNSKEIEKNNSKKLLSFNHKFGFNEREHYGYGADDRALNSIPLSAKFQIKKTND